MLCQIAFIGRGGTISNLLAKLMESSPSLCSDNEPDIVARSKGRCMDPVETTPTTPSFAAGGGAGTAVGKALTGRVLSPCNAKAVNLNRQVRDHTACLHHHVQKGKITRHRNRHHDFKSCSSSCSKYCKTTFILRPNSPLSIIVPRIITTTISQQHRHNHQHETKALRNHEWAH